MPRRSHHAAARMRARPAEVQAINRRSVFCPACDRSHEKQLVNRHVAVKNVAARERILALKIERRDYVAMNDGVANVRRVFGKRVNATISEHIFHRIPISVAQSVRRVLSEDAHDVFAGRGYRIVICCRDSKFEQRLFRRSPGLRVFPSAINVLHRRADVHSRFVLRAELAARISFEVGQGIEREVNLERAPLHPHRINLAAKAFVQVALLNELQKSYLRVCARYYHSRVYLFAVIERDSISAAIAHEHASETPTFVRTCAPRDFAD